jgi:hypothetical protein
LDERSLSRRLASPDVGLTGLDGPPVPTRLFATTKTALPTGAREPDGVEFATPLSAPTPPDARLTDTLLETDDSLIARLWASEPTLLRARTVLAWLWLGATAEPEPPMDRETLENDA